jgi:hypothetical protein
VQTDDARTSLPSSRPPETLDLEVGELVEVRPVGEILASLDERGRLEALPFMPEMLQFAGRQFRVSKRAFKMCDQVGHSNVMHRMERAVHLEGTRCDGQAHGGCQAGCLLYWKESWLQRADPRPAVPPEDTAATPTPAQSAIGPGQPRCTVDTLVAATRPEGADPSDERFSCQATEMLNAAPTPVRAFDPRQYLEDIATGNARLLPTVRGVLIRAFNKYQKLSMRFLPRPLWIHGGGYYPFIDGKIVEGRTPKETLDLQPGELVEVRSKEEIFETLDQQNFNRGLRFDVEALRYCGRRARVLRRVTRIIDDATGKMIHIPGDCIVLDGFVCVADYHQNCPRAIWQYWREIWLRRVEE